MLKHVPLDIKEAAASLRDGSVTSVELTATMLERITTSQERLGAFVTVCEDTAMQAAQKADAELASGMDRGPLCGIPLAVKDIIATRDAPTTANSRVLDAAWGHGVDAPVVTRLREAGAVIVGKSTTSEFACGMPDPDKGFPIPRNPWNVEHTPAGSSSGTGIAVAAGLALGGLGTDTGGSVRAPAAANGHTGLKVTFGRVPKSGVVPLAYSLDSVGPMARSAYDCALLLNVIAGHHPDDPYSARAEVPDYLAALSGPVEGVRIGVPMPYFFDATELDGETRDAVLRAVELLAGQGAVVQDTAVPLAKEAKDANTLTMAGEAFAYHRNDLISRWSDYGCHTRPILARGALTTAADYSQAQRLRSRFQREMAGLFDSFDVLITPATLGPAERVDRMQTERRFLGPSFTAQWNLAGNPAVVIPCGIHSTGLPVALQIVGPAFGEGLVLRVADAFQRFTDWHRRMPAEFAGVPALA